VHLYLLGSRETEGDENEGEIEEEENWYLCLTLGRPTEEKKLNQLRPHMVVSYGHKGTCVQPEYWFAISPMDRQDVKDLYHYWNLWWPHLYKERVNQQVNKYSHLLNTFFSSVLLLAEMQCVLFFLFS